MGTIINSPLPLGEGLGVRVRGKNMQKLKTNKSAAKRFKRTATGGYKHRRTNRDHIFTKKATKRKCQVRNTKQDNKKEQKAVKKMLIEM